MLKWVWFLKIKIILLNVVEHQICNFLTDKENQCLFNIFVNNKQQKIKNKKNHGMSGKFSYVHVVPDGCDVFLHHSRIENNNVNLVNSALGTRAKLPLGTSSYL